MRYLTDSYGMPRHPPRRVINSYAMTWDAVGMPWYVMGGTMPMPRQNQVVSNPAFFKYLTLGP